MTSNGTTPQPKGIYKNRALRRPYYSKDVTSQQQFRSLLLEAMNQHRSRYLKKRARQRAELMSTTEEAALTTIASAHQNGFDVPFQRRSNTGGTKAKQSSSVPGDQLYNHLEKLRFQRDKTSTKPGRTFQTSKRHGKTSTGGYSSLLEKDDKQATECSVVRGPFYKITTKDSGPKSRDGNPPWRKSNDDKIERNSLTEQKTDHSNGLGDQDDSAGFKQESRRHRAKSIDDDTSAKCRQKTTDCTSSPYFILDHIDEDVINGKKDLYILPTPCNDKPRPNAESPKSTKSIERRKFGLQKLRKTFTERKRSTAQTTSNDACHGDPGSDRRENSNLRDRDKIQPPSFLSGQSRGFDTMLSQPNRTEANCDIPVKSFTVRALSDAKTKKPIGCVNFKNICGDLHGAGTDFTVRTSMMADAQKAKEKRSSLANQMESMPTTHEARHKVQGQTPGIQAVKGTHRDVAEYECVEQVQKSKTNPCLRSQRRVQAFRNRDAVVGSKTFDKKRASSAGIPGRQLSLGAIMMRRARSLGIQENELLSPSIKHNKREPRASRSRIQMTQKVRFDNHLDETSLEQSQQEMRTLLRRYLAGGPHQKSKPLNTKKTTGEPHGRFECSPVFLYSPLKELSLVSLLSICGVQNVKTHRRSRSPVKRNRSIERSSNSPSPKSWLHANPVRVTKFCSSLSSPPAKDRRKDEFSTSPAKRLKKKKITSTGIDDSHMTNNDTLEQKCISKPEEKKELSYSSRSPPTNALKSVGKDNLRPCRFKCTPVPSGGQKENHVDRGKKTLHESNPSGDKPAMSCQRNKQINKNCDKPTPSTTPGNTAPVQHPAPSSRVIGDDKQDSPEIEKEQAKIVKTALHRPPTLFTEHRAQKRTKLKEKEAKKQKRATKLASSQNERAGLTTNQANHFKMPDDKELCGWESNTPERLSFLQTCDPAEFQVVGSNERCSFMPQTEEKKSLTEPRFELDKGHEDLQLNKKPSSTHLELKSNTDCSESDFSDVTREHQTPSSDNGAEGLLYFPTENKCKSKDVQLPDVIKHTRYRPKQKCFPKYHCKHTNGQKKSKSNPKHPHIEEDGSSYQRELVKQVICSVLHSLHHTASRLVEIREKIDILKRTVSKTKTTKDKTCLAESSSTKDSKTWTPTVFDYMKLVAFMGLQLLAQFVFVQK